MSRCFGRVVAPTLRVNAEGYREILGIDVTTAEDRAGWLSFLRADCPGSNWSPLMRTRGLLAAVGATLPGASWQRSSVNIGGGGMIPPRGA